MYCSNIFLLGLTSRHKAFSAGLECPAGQWPWYSKDSAHKNRTRGRGEKENEELSCLKEKVQNISIGLAVVTTENRESRLIKFF